ncbi:MAG: 2-amino-4-hydroxy-6-hydroxymethyldihydropteridine diphosphokinase [Paludibacteraceae bacterium]|nr:2-amino-4-hydroxy-6-hydroxymethyldihydropteridine diphosphokinase [Paludibacteraceae bacterium]
MRIYLSLGSNISPRHHYINEACRLLSERCGTLVSRSSDYYSAPMGYASTHEYLNICVCLLTSLSPMELLEATQTIERELGRTHKSSFDPATQTFDYKDRTIDIDLIQAFDDSGCEIILQTPPLTLPHPRMTDRPFVLQPLQQMI